jgi:hypothetical protein
VTAFVRTSADEGWATGVVITNTLTGWPDKSMILHYTSGHWEQVGDAQPSTYLDSLEMASGAEGWALGSDGQGHGVMLHITGGTWQHTSLPAAIPQGAPLFLRMRTADEGWLVMSNPKGATGVASTSLLRYSNGKWSLVQVPLFYITDVAPVATGEAWAVGRNRDNSSSLVHVKAGTASVTLTTSRGTDLDRLRAFASADVWAEGTQHPVDNDDIHNTPLLYHYDGSGWQPTDLHAPSGAQQIQFAATGEAWAFASVSLSSTDHSNSVIQSIYHSHANQWEAVSLPYRDLMSLSIIARAAGDPTGDLWAIGMYLVSTPTTSTNGETTYAGIGHTVLLHYTNGTWTEYGR